MQQLLVPVNRTAGSTDDDALQSALSTLQVDCDGSVHAARTALDGLAAAEPVGIIPCGTGNDLAQALGLPVAVAGNRSSADPNDEDPPWLESHGGPICVRGATRYIRTRPWAF
jgi:hypothetical protein